MPGCSRRRGEGPCCAHAHPTRGRRPAGDRAGRLFPRQRRRRRRRPSAAGRSQPERCVVGARASRSRSGRSGCARARWSRRRAAVTSTGRGSRGSRAPARSASVSPSGPPPIDTSRLGTVVPHEGGPGYATTGQRLVVRRDVRTAAAPAQPAARRPARDRAVGADRLPGAAEPEDRLLRRGRGSARRASATAPTTTRRALSADDLAAVIRALGLAPRRPVRRLLRDVLRRRSSPAGIPDLLRSIVLDSAYPTYGETAWYPTQGPAMRRSFDDGLRARSPACGSAGAGFARSARTGCSREVRAASLAGRLLRRDGRRHARDA